MKSKEAIVVLSAGIKKDSQGEWKNTDLNQEDNSYGAPGGNLRVLAASILYKQNPDQYIIASGGRGWDIKNDKAGRPDLSKIIKAELTDLGIPGEVIIEENNSNNTYQQLKELKKIIENYNLKYLKIITNQWHVHRVKAMLEHLDELKDLLKQVEIKFITAEEVVIKDNPGKWQKEIDSVYQSDWLKQRIKMEQQGLKQIKNGTYKYE
ncbi:YdcF family protein [Patescibacteria group bacterium]|nr:YdcF family protein [Patescibacteria group bacterium]